jgi:hypothetical protein
MQASRRRYRAPSWWEESFPAATWLLGAVSVALIAGGLILSFQTAPTPAPPRPADVTPSPAFPYVTELYAAHSAALEGGSTAALAEARPLEVALSQSATGPDDYRAFVEQRLLAARAAQSIPWAHHTALETQRAQAHIAFLESELSWSARQQ